MKGQLSRFRKVLRCPEGQALAEYALILAFVALAAVGALTLLGVAVGGFFERFSSMPPFG